MLLDTIPSHPPTPAWRFFGLCPLPYLFPLFPISLLNSTPRFSICNTLDSDYRFSLSLGTTLMKGLRYPPMCSSAESLLQSLLQFGACFIQPLPQSSHPSIPTGMTPSSVRLYHLCLSRGVSIPLIICIIVF